MSHYHSLSFRNWLLFACLAFSVACPPLVRADEGSTIALQVTANLDDVRAEVLKALAKKTGKDDPIPTLPLALAGQGKSVTLSLPMYTTQNVTEKVTRMVVEEVVEKVKRLEKSIVLVPQFKKVLGVPVPLPPLPTEVFKEVMEDVKRHVPRQIVEEVKKKVEALVDATKVEFSYRVELTELRLTVRGDELSCSASVQFHINGKPLEPTVVPSRPTSLTLSGKLATRKKLTWNEAGQLTFTAGESKVWIDPASGLGAFPGLNPLNILKLNLAAEVLAGNIDDEVQKKLREQDCPLDLKLILAQVEKSGHLATPEVRVGDFVLVASVPLAVAEVQAYPIQGEDNTVRLNLTLNCVPATKKRGETRVVPAQGPAPTPLLNGQVVRLKTGPKKGELDVEWKLPGK